MHHLPVQRRGLGLEERELLELHAEGWSSPLIASMLDIPAAEIAARLRALCAALDIAPRSDGRPPVHAARMWLVEEARRLGDGASRRLAA
jgi:hypothetical protein